MSTGINKLTTDGATLGIRKAWDEGLSIGAVMRHRSVPKSCPTVGHAAAHQRQFRCIDNARQSGPEARSLVSAEFHTAISWQVRISALRNPSSE
jgi:hypothetical protein